MRSEEQLVRAKTGFCSDAQWQKTCWLSSVRTSADETQSGEKLLFLLHYWVHHWQEQVREKNIKGATLNRWRWHGHFATFQINRSDSPVYTNAESSVQVHCDVGQVVPGWYRHPAIPCKSASVDETDVPDLPLVDVVKIIVGWFRSTISLPVIHKELLNVPQYFHQHLNSFWVPFISGVWLHTHSLTSTPRIF